MVPRRSGARCVRFPTEAWGGALETAEGDIVQPRPGAVHHPQPALCYEGGILSGDALGTHGPAEAEAATGAGLRGGRRVGGP